MKTRKEITWCCESYKNGKGHTCHMTPTHTPTPEIVSSFLRDLAVKTSDDKELKFRLHELADTVYSWKRAVNAHKELLAIVQAIAESFNAGANQVYAEALAPHTDDETLKTWINKAIAKATGGK